MGSLSVVRGSTPRLESRNPTGPQSIGFAGVMQFGRQDILRIDFNRRTTSNFFSRSSQPSFESLVTLLCLQNCS